MKPLRAEWSSIVALVLTLASAAGQPSPRAGDAFYLLTFRMKTGEVAMVRSQLVPGTLKSQPAPQFKAPLLVALEDTNGLELATARLDDPSVRRYEYEDPDHPGAIQFKVVPVEDTEFMIRIPQPAGATRVAVYRETTVAGTPSPEKAKPPERELLKRFDLSKTPETK
jgi:hypothetical protein